MASPNTAGPFGEGEVGRDDDRRSLVEPAYQVEQQLAARLGERQIAEFVEHHQIDAGELLGQPAGDAGAGLGLQTVDQVDDIEEARPSVALAYAIGGDGDRQMAFAGARPADEYDIALCDRGIRRACRSRTRASLTGLPVNVNWVSSLASGSLATPI